MPKIKLSKNFIINVCKLALNEDLYPSGDITSNLLKNNITKKVKLLSNQAGIIGGLLCQGLSPHNAATLATYIHLQCADSFNQKYGNSGLIASDLINAIPIVVKELSQHT